MSVLPERIEPLPPGSTVGIVGTGQLGAMLAEAAARLGFRTHAYGPEEGPPASRVASAFTQAPYEDEDALARFAGQVDVATYEWESIPPVTVRTLARHVPVRPDDKVLAVCQDRLAEKTFLRSLGVRTAPFAPMGRVSEGAGALAEVGPDAILKSRRFGYDGKGQARLRPGDDPAVAFAAIGGVEAILEGFVRFDFEVSMIGARDLFGETAFYEPPRNGHEDGVLRRSIVPSGLPASARAEAEDVLGRIMEELDYVGVLTAEFFWSQDGGLVANELAPRVHNSGHWTREACVTSQFEQHVRAVAGWPLGDPARQLDAEMENLLGADADGWLELAGDAGARVTLYGKREARPGRKMGHVVRTWPLGTRRSGQEAEQGA